MTQNTEQDVRVEILNSFLTTPHHNLSGLAPLHREALQRDPLFYGHLAPWYFEKGEVRDHRILFIGHLATSDFPEFREAAWVLLQKLAPFEVARVLDHTKRVIGKTPRSLKGAIAHYLQVREKNVRQFDGAALRARDDLKHLYASLRLKPGPRAQAILFDEQPPEDSSLYALKRLSQLESAEEQALLILEHKIPYTTAIGAVKHITPALLVALINTMSPQEVINNMASLKRRGALDEKEVKALIDQKLAEAISDKRVSTLKAKKVIEVGQLDEETERTLTELTDKRIAEKVEITRPTALFVDKSSSMTQAIDVAKQIAALISAVINADFHVYAFDSAAFEVEMPQTAGKRPTLSDWEKTFKLIQANGRTSIGAPLAKMTKDRVYAETLMVVTDEGENTAPYFHEAYRQYVREMKVSPTVVIVQVDGTSKSFIQILESLNIEVMRYKFAGDYYALPNLLSLLAAPSRAELVDQIMQYELPKRPKPVV